FSKDAGEAVDHAVLAADDRSVEAAINLVKPSGQPNAAGHAVQFGDARPRISQQNVRPDHVRDFVLKGEIVLQLEQRRRLAAVQIVSDPGRLFARDTLAVKEIDGAIKLQQHSAKRFQLLRQLWAKYEWGRGDAPGLTGEEAA